MKKRVIKRKAILNVMVALLLVCAACSADLYPPPLDAVFSEIKAEFKRGKKGVIESQPDDDDSIYAGKDTDDPEAKKLSLQDLDKIDKPTYVADKAIDDEAKKRFKEITMEHEMSFASEYAAYGSLVSDPQYTYFINSAGAVMRYKNNESPDEAKEFLYNERLQYLVSSVIVDKTESHSEFYRLVAALENYSNPVFVDAISYNYQTEDPSSTYLTYDNSSDPRWASPDGTDKVLMADQYYVWCQMIAKSGKVQFVKFGSKIEYFGYLDYGTFDDIIAYRGGAGPLIEVIKNGISRFYMIDIRPNRQNIKQNAIPLPKENSVGNMKKHGNFFLFFEQGERPGVYCTVKRFLPTMMPSDLAGIKWERVYDGEVQDAFATQEYIFVVLVDATNSKSVLRIDRETKQIQPVMSLQDTGAEIFMPEFGNCIYTWGNDGTVSRHYVIGNIHYKCEVGVLDLAPPANAQMLFTKDYVFAYDIAGKYKTRPNNMIGYLNLF